MALAITSPLQQFFDLDGKPLDDGSLYFGVANQNPETNPITVYWDAAATQPAAQPVRTMNGYPFRSGSPAVLYVNGDYSLTVRNRKGDLVVYVASGAAVSSSLVLQAQITALISDLSNTTDPAKGDALIGVKRTATGAIGTTQHEVNEARPFDPVLDFGCDPTGLTNTTTEMKAFFDACIATGRPGLIPEGDYLITAGVLVFDTAFTDKVWPVIDTAGEQAVKFLRADATNAPMITLSNGTATSGAGRYWRGGKLGGIWFDQNGQTTASGQHGISLVGVWGIEFGWMRGDDLGGSLVFCPQTLFAGFNPDPYAITFCNFRAIEANRCLRYGVENNNGVGLNFCTFDTLRVIECMLGGWYGVGSGNVLKYASMGTVKGWAFDDGVFASAPAGTPNKLLIELAELDDVQNGFRLNRINNVRVLTARFVHRYNFNPSFNPGEGYWPRKAVEVAGGTSPNVASIDMDLLHRIEAGGAKVNMGLFVDFSNNANIIDFNVDHRIQDNAGFGFTGTDVTTALNANAQAKVLLTGIPVADRIPKVAAYARSSTSDTVPNSGFTTAAAKIAFGTELYDGSGYYNTATSEFTVPYRGLYRVRARICIALTAGQRIRLAVAYDRGGAISLAAFSQQYAQGSAAQTYEVSGLFDANAGDKLFVMADQNSGSATVALSAPISATSDLQFSVEAL